MTKTEAAFRCRVLANIVRISMAGDEGAESWAQELDEIALGLDPQEKGWRGVSPEKTALRDIAEGRTSTLHAAQARAREAL